MDAIDLLWLVIICLAVLVILIVLNVYNAKKLGFFGWVKENKKPIIITVGWSLVVAIILIKAYWSIYLANPRLFESGVFWTQISDWTPHVDLLDMIMIFIASIVAGALLLEIETIVYGVIANFILSLVFAVIWATFFIWYALGIGLIPDFVAWGLPDQVSFIVYIASRNVFRMAFPFVYVLAFMGVFVGAFGRALIQPSSGFGQQ